MSCVTFYAELDVTIVGAPRRQMCCVLYRSVQSSINKKPMKPRLSVADWLEVVDTNREDRWTISGQLVGSQAMHEGRTLQHRLSVAGCQ